MDSQAAKPQATKPEPAPKDLTDEQLPAIENLRLHQPMTMGSGKEYIEKLRSLEDGWGQIHHGVQRRSNTLNELRAGFSEFKKEVEAVEKLLKSRKW
ncbi:uncharacterized protein TrAtP1_007467 [Trichoderma atroviride]|uniref:uncharacterized protein n=1 Tax=Hypocrea atroviridis TaxID=63577 RepID=UPI00332FB690|nr:hypothetical protein TrAtP1_007467 [Trichoderma atroviride]